MKYLVAFIPLSWKQLMIFKIDVIDEFSVQA